MIYCNTHLVFSISDRRQRYEMMHKVLPVSFVFVGSKSDRVYGTKLGGGGGGMRMERDRHEREER